MVACRGYLRWYWDSPLCGADLFPIVTTATVRRSIQ
jgi:hypothetical protein